MHLDVLGHVRTRKPYCSLSLSISKDNHWKLGPPQASEDIWPPVHTSLFPEATDFSFAAIWPALGLLLSLPCFFGQLIHSCVLAFAQQSARSSTPCRKAATSIPVLCKL